MDIPGLDQSAIAEAMRQKTFVNKAVTRMRMRVLASSAVADDECDDEPVLDVYTSIDIVAASLRSTIVAADRRETMDEGQLRLLFEVLALTSSISGTGDDGPRDDALDGVFPDDELRLQDDSQLELERVGKHIADVLKGEIETAGAAVDEEQLAVAAAFFMASNWMADLRDQGALSPQETMELISQIEGYCIESLNHDRTLRHLH